MEVELVVEIPAGSRNKYEFEHETGTLWLDRRLYTAARCPADYGYVESTKGDDGDALDGLVILDEPAVPGCHVWVRTLGILWIDFSGRREGKVLTVPVWDQDRDWASIGQVPDAQRREIAQFFEVYKEISASQTPRILGWEDAEAADAEILRCRQRLAS
ncbi:MAG: inorganic diphosphatase [Candidatus Dormibacteria bacterium]